MFSKEVVVRCESGLYNKQASFFVQKANEFDCGIWLEYGSSKINAKSLLGVMSMRLATGACVTISAEGTDELAAVESLEILLQRDLV